MPMFLLAVDGIDGVGKDTQALLLQQYLQEQGLRVRVVTCPAPDSPLRAVIAEVLQRGNAEPQALQMLFIAERILEQSKWLNQPLDVVILVRSVWATLVYGEALGIDIDWLMYLIKPVSDPDLIFLLDMPVADAMARTPTEDPLESDVTLQEYCRKRYLELANQANNWSIVDGSGSIDVVHEAMVQALRGRFPKLTS